jgi:hypothetical protein
MTNGGIFPSTAIYRCNTGYVLTDSNLGTNQCVADTSIYLEDPPGMAHAKWNTQANATCTGTSLIRFFTCCDRLNDSMTSFGADSDVIVGDD